MPTFDPADQKLLHALIEGYTRAVADELPTAPREEIAAEAIRCLATELTYLAETGEGWARRLLNLLGEP